jgi:PAS domain S-box-containing protein
VTRPRSAGAGRGGGNGGDPLRRPGNEFFRAAFDSTIVGVVVTDAEGRIVRANATAARMLGYRVGELRGVHVLEITHPDDREKSLRQIKALWSGRIPRIRIKKRYLHRDGRTLWVRTHVMPVKRPGGTPEYAVATMEDISGRMETEEDLRASREFAANVFQNVDESMTVIDARTRKIIAVNRSFLRLMGREEGEVLGKDCWEVIHPDGRPFDPENNPCPMERAVRTGRPARSEFEFESPDGRPLNVEVSIYPVRGETGEVDRVIHIHRDITERKRAETIQSVLFQISEATGSAVDLDELFGVIHKQLGRLIDTRNFYIALYEGPEGGYSFPFVEDECDEQVDFSPRELRKSLTDYVRRTGRAILVDKKTHSRLREAGEVEVVGQPSEIWLGAPLRTGKDVIGIVAVQSYHDPGHYTKKDLDLLSFVSDQIALAIERKRAEDELRSSKEFVENVFQNVVDSICVVDPWTYEILGANRAFLESVNCRESEVLGRTCHELTHGLAEPCQGPDNPCPLEETRRTGQPCRREHVHRLANGRRAWAEVRTSAIRGEGGEVERIIHISHDITERKRSETVQSVLFRISEATGSAGHLDSLFRVIHEQLGRLIDTRNFYIALYDEESGAYDFPYCVDEREPVLGKGRHLMENSLTDLVRRTGRPMRVDGDVLRKLESEGVARSIGTRSAVWLGAPLRASGRAIGVVSVQSYDDPDLLTQKDLDLLTFVSDHIAMAIERKQKDESLRESEQRLKAIFDSARDSVFIKDRDLRYTRVNPAMEQLFGLSAAEIEGKTDEDLFGQEGGEEIRKDDERVLAGEVVEREHTKMVRGVSMTFHVIKVPMRDGDGAVQGICGIARDVTDRKRVDRMKDEFISVVSHELRTPLTSIHGAIDLIRSGRAGEIPERVQALLEIAVRNSVRLRKLIDDLLDIQKIESGKVELDLRPLRLPEIVRQSIENNRTFGEQFRVKFVLDEGIPDIRVKADGRRLTQVMDNLLSNAAKFSPPDSKVEIRVSRRNGSARVDVRDHGPGIPEEFRPRIFRKFTQADSSMTRERGGTGLGLSIAKSIVERLGGTIGFETEPDSGTTFYFELPEYKGPEQPDDDGD